MFTTAAYPLPRLVPGLLLLIAGVAAAQAADDADLAKQLVNPVGPLTSVQGRLGYDRLIGPDDGQRLALEVEPVVPIALGADWSLVSHTQLPLIVQHDVAGHSGNQTGFGDLIETAYVSPKAPTANGLVWGAGPVILVPTATESRLGSEHWGIGPAGTLLRESGPWTIGAIGNHIWSGDESDARAINATLIKPFAAYVTPQAMTFAADLAATYDWHAREWSLPIEATVSRVARLDGRPVSVGAGLRYWLHSTDRDPEQFGIVMTAAMLFPR